MRHGLILLSDSTSYAQTHCIKDGGIRPLYLPVNGTAVVPDKAYVFFYFKNAPRIMGILREKKWPILAF
jgi:hypothetical protein